MMLFFLSCNDRNVSSIEAIIGLDLRHKVSFEEKWEEWVDLNGNGQKIIVYKIEGHHLQTVIDEARKNGFEEYNYDDLDFSSNRKRLSTYIENSMGVYKTFLKNNEVKTVLIDSTHSKLVYQLIVL